MENKSLLNLSPAQLRRAAELKEKIDQLSAELGQILGGGSASVVRAAGSGRRQMSPAARAKIAAAARARWAKFRAGKSGAKGGGIAAPAPKKRKMSAAGRAKIAAAAKARWAKVRAAKAGQ